MAAKVRFLLLAAGLILTGYAAWIYVGGAIRERSESRAFDKERDAVTSGRDDSRPSPFLKEARPKTAKPFRARLVIPRLRIRTVVEEGDDDSVLRYAAGHIPSTSLPGEAGNVGLAAHRDTIFRDLRLIHTGDRIVLQTVSHDYQYVVDNMSIVDPSNVGVLRNTPGAQTLTLVTCYPFSYVGSAPQRFIVHAHLTPGPASLAASSSRP